MSSWYELGLARDANLRETYESLSELGVKRVHHFGNEPWHPGRWVVRVEVEDQADEFLETVTAWDAVDVAGPWTREQDDRDLYGSYFDWAMDFFQASSMLATAGETPEEVTANSHKLVHCVLNAHGQSDTKWALKHLIGRARLMVRLSWHRLLGRKWWEPSDV